MDSSKNIILLVDSECIPYECIESSFKDYIRILKLTALKLLCYFNFISTKVSDVNNFRWGHKIFSSFSELSCSIVNHRSALNEITLESLEDFEDVLFTKLLRLKRRKILSVSDSDHQLDDSVESVSVNFDNIESNQDVAYSSFQTRLQGSSLVKALRESLHDFEWNIPQILSPVKNPGCQSRSSSNISADLPSPNLQDEFGNFVFLFCKCPNDLHQLQTFVNKTYKNAQVIDVSDDDVLHSFMPSSLRMQFHVQTKINLMWIDTSTLFSDSNTKVSTLEVKQSIQRALNQINGSLVPVEALVQCSASGGMCKKIFVSSNGYDPVYVDSIFPSTVFLNYYLKYNRKIHEELQANSTSIPVSLQFNKDVIRISMKAHIYYSFKCKNSGKNFSKSQANTFPEICYSVISSMHKDIFSKLLTSEILMCVPETSSKTSFSRLTSKLMEENLILILSDSNTYGLVSAVFIPISSGTGNIQKLDLEMSLKIKKKYTVFDKSISNISLTNDTFDLNSIVHQTISSVSPKMEMKEYPVSREHLISEDCREKTSCFTLSCVENWFIPNHELGSKYKNSARLANKRDNLFRMLKKSYESSTTRYYQDSGFQSRETFVQDEHIKQAIQREESWSDMDDSQKIDATEYEYDKELNCTLEALNMKEAYSVIPYLKKRYNTIINNESCLMTGAQNIVATLAHHVKNDTQKMDYLVNNHLILNSLKIAEKYDDDPSSELRMKEYQFQTLLLLENELRDPYKDVSCTDVVIGFLRTMSFLFGLSCLSNFLSDVIFVNYLPPLEEIIVQICRDLDLPLPPGISATQSSSDEEDGASETSSVKTDIYSFSHSSVASSTSSGSFLNPDSVKSNLKRKSDRSNLEKKLQKRQIVVPVKENKKKKEKPKLEKSKTTSHIEKTAVRRNLFANASPTKLKRRNTTCCVIEASPRKLQNELSRASLLKTPKKHTPKKGKSAAQRKQATTPKGRHVLKTTFVPATPEHKEGSLGIMRRQQQLRRKTEGMNPNETVEESPDKAAILGQPSTSKASLLKSLIHQSPKSPYSSRFKDFSLSQLKSPNSMTISSAKTPTKFRRAKIASKALFKTPTKPSAQIPKQSGLLSPNRSHFLRSSEIEENCIETRSQFSSPNKNRLRSSLFEKSETHSFVNDYSNGQRKVSLPEIFYSPDKGYNVIKRPRFSEDDSYLRNSDNLNGNDCEFFSPVKQNFSHQFKSPEKTPVKSGYLRGMGRTVQDISEVISASPSKGYPLRSFDKNFHQSHTSPLKKSSHRQERISFEDQSGTSFDSPKKISSPRKCLKRSYQEDFAISPSKMYNKNINSKSSGTIPVDTDSSGIVKKLTVHDLSDSKTQSMTQNEFDVKPVKKRSLRLTAERRSRRSELKMLTEKKEKELTMSPNLKIENVSAYNTLQPDFTYNVKKLETLDNPSIASALKCKVVLERSENTLISTELSDEISNNEYVNKFTKKTTANTSSSFILKDANSPEKLNLNVSNVTNLSKKSSEAEPNIKTSPGDIEETSSLKSRVSMNSSFDGGPSAQNRNFKRKRSNSLSDSTKIFSAGIAFSFAHQRVTRNLAQDIGLSPETVRCLSILSPQNNSVKKKKKNPNETTVQNKPVTEGTPSTSNISHYISPSAESIEHLTSSPIVQKRKSLKPPLCRKRLM